MGKNKIGITHSLSNMIEKFLKDTFYLQRILHLGGYDCGQVDGIRGKKTNKALERWLLDADLYKRSYGTLDDRSEKNLDTLLPICQKLVRQWFLNKVRYWAADNEVLVKIIAGTRTWKEQDDLYAQGRTKNGNKVTNAKSGSSFHNYGIAFDIGIFSKDGKYHTDNELYEKLVQDCGCPSCFENGGKWKSLRDYPHFQYESFGNSSAKIRKHFLSKG